MSHHERQNRVAIVTGSSRGVGAAVAKLLAQNHYHVVINYSKSEKEALEVQAACAAAGAETLLCRANVADDADCRRMVQETITKWGRLDALVNNAGTTKFCAHDNLEGLAKEDFIGIYNVNLVGPYQLIRAAAPHLKKTGKGAVVNIASTAGLTGNGSCIAYCASKGALITMTKSLARALGPEIRVNAVCPGFIQGEWLQDGMGRENYELLKNYLEAVNPLRRTATPETIAPTVLFLIEEACLITGDILVLDGGYHLGAKMTVSSPHVPKP